MKMFGAFVLMCLLTFNAFASGTVVINGKSIKTRDELHSLMAKSLSFPKYYGKNLDALYDVLTSDFSGESIIKIKNLNILRVRIGNDYVQSFLETLGDASEVNGRVILLLE